MEEECPTPYDLYSVFQYPWMGFNLFAAIWLFSVLCRTVLNKYAPRRIRQAFHALDEDKKRNTITYVILLVGTTVSLISQVYGGMDILFRYQDTTSPERIEWAVFSVQCIFVLYVWELIYRLQIGVPLLAHHICCISLCQLVSASFVDTHDVKYLRFAILLGFQATTEQLSFVALLLFRLNYCLQYQSVLFFGAAAMSLVLKTVVTIAALEYYTRAFEFDADVMVGWDYFWAIMVVPIIAVLFTAQVFACNVLYGLGCRCRDSFQDGMQPILKRVHLDASTSRPKEASKEALSAVPSSADAPPESAVRTESAESLVEDGRSPPPPDLFHQVVAIVGDGSLVPVRMATVPEQFRLYGLYMRVTKGKLCENDVARPRRWDVAAQQKYKAWKKADSLTEAEAMAAYIALAEELEGAPVTEAIQNASQRLQV